MRSSRRTPRDLRSFVASASGIKAVGGDAASLGEWWIAVTFLIPEELLARACEPDGVSKGPVRRLPGVRKSVAWCSEPGVGWRYTRKEVIRIDFQSDK